MKTLKLHLDYRCYPVWIYGEDGAVEENVLPSELAEDPTLTVQLDHIQADYDCLFLDNGVEFSYQGTAEQERKLDHCLTEVYTVLCARLRGQYQVKLELLEEEVRV